MLTTNNSQSSDWRNLKKIIACGFLFLCSQYASADTNYSCERYADSAISQDQANQALGANFGGPRWSSDFSGHYNWCRHGRNAIYTAWEMGEREKALQEYAVKTNQRPCQRYAREAVRQYLVVEAFESTEFQAPRWSDDYYDHLSWCQYGNNLERSIDETAYREQVLQDYAVKYNLNEGRDNSFTTDFEEGFLRSWIKTGTAFNHQPTKDDNATARLRGQPSDHAGSYWIGTYEKYQGRKNQQPGDIQGDGPTETLTSPEFEIGSEISLLIGGGAGFNTRVELLSDGVIVKTAHGRNTESMHRETWKVGNYAGTMGQIRIVDDESDGWGHINVDDIKIIPRITETIVDECSRQVAIVPRYRVTPNSLGTMVLNLDGDRTTGWTDPFSVELSESGYLGWWCNSTKGNWADLGTWRFSASGFDVDCAFNLGLAAGSGGSAGKICFPIKGLNLGSSASDGWTAERSRCKDKSTKIRARLIKEVRYIVPDEYLEIQCLGH